MANPASLVPRAHVGPRATHQPHSPEGQFSMSLGTWWHCPLRVNPGVPLAQGDGTSPDSKANRPRPPRTEHRRFTRRRSATAHVPRVGRVTACPARPVEKGDVLLSRGADPWRPRTGIETGDVCQATSETDPLAGSMALRLAGLATLCPWRRSPMPKRRGGQRVDNPLDDLGRGERSFHGNRGGQSGCTYPYDVRAPCWGGAPLDQEAGHHPLVDARERA